ncbi:hypothetical protein SLA2020_090490 [Shorea laevis]
MEINNNTFNLCADSEIESKNTESEKGNKQYSSEIKISRDKIEEKAYGLIKIEDEKRIREELGSWLQSFRFLESPATRANDEAIMKRARVFTFYI